MPIAIKIPVISLVDHCNQLTTLTILLLTIMIECGINYTVNSNMPNLQPSLFSTSAMKSSNTPTVVAKPPKHPPNCNSDPISYSQSINDTINDIFLLQRELYPRSCSYV